MVVIVVYRKQLESCFFRTLEELDPGFAAELSTRDKVFKKGVTAKMQDKLLGAVTAAEDDIRIVSDNATSALGDGGWGRGDQNMHQLHSDISFKEEQ
jgi:hypothetical protein